MKLKRLIALLGEYPETYNFDVYSGMPAIADEEDHIVLEINTLDDEVTHEEAEKRG